MTSPASVCSLARVASFRVPSRNFYLVISRGSVVDFAHKTQSSAIVNAANEGCLGGGGVDGAIGDAGGPALLEDRMNLPQLEPGIRCLTGSAVSTGPNSYGSLHVPFVIHAVGPNYMQYDTEEEMAQGDDLLSSAYTASLECGKSHNIEAIAFALLSAGIFRGKRSVDEVVQIGIDSICKFDGYPALQEVHLCAFNQKEANTLIRVATGLLGLSEI
jgi:O-acetyl-ADP-ribose deacetylase (regulator of RNase III)